MRIATPLAVLVMLMTALAGCIGAEEAAPAAADDPSTQSDTASDDAASNETEAPAEPAPEATPPVASIDASGDGVTSGDGNDSVTHVVDLGSMVRLDASNSTDPSNGTLTYAWAIGNETTSNETAVNWTAEEAGMTLVRLNVTSAESGLSNSTSIVLLVVAQAAGAPEPVIVEDATGDGGAPVSDVTEVVITQDETHLLVATTLVLAQPGNSVEQIACVNVYVNGDRYEQYMSVIGNGVYSYSAGGDVSGATTSASGNTVLVGLPFDAVGEGPYDMSVTTRIGECTLAGGSQVMDLAPDEGTVVYG